jgi:predicted transposase/invertase (TIGR01784 family)
VKKSKKIENNKNSHDTFVKKAMSDKNVAKEFFEANLPQDILSQVDLNTLNQEKEHYFDNTLGNGVVDLIYSVNFGIDKGYLILLVEHQSNQDYKMPLRIMKYVLRICDDYLKKNKGEKIPLIYPILFYGGEQKYTAPLSIYSLFINSERAKEFLTKPIQLVETNNYKKEDIRGRAYAGLMMYFMSKIRERDIFPYLHEVIELIGKISREGDIEYIESILYYIIDRADTEKVDGIFAEFKKAVTIEHSEKLMTIAERLEQRGIEKGILSGLEKGKLEGRLEGLKEGELKGKLEIAKKLLNSGSDKKEVAKITDLPISKIEELKD